MRQTSAAHLELVEAARIREGEAAEVGLDSLRLLRSHMMTLQAATLLIDTLVLGRKSNPVRNLTEAKAVYAEVNPLILRPGARSSPR